MEIHATLLCDSATVREGLLHVLGGGITRVWIPQLPGPIGVALATLVALQPDEMGQLHEVHVAVNSPNRRIVEGMGALQVARPPNIEPGESVVVPFVLPLHNAGTAEYGRHVVELSIDDGAAESQLTFWVLHPDERVLPNPHGG
jgi:hypothetical protein